MQDISNLRQENVRSVTKEVLAENHQYFTDLNELKSLQNGRFSMVLEGFMYECFYQHQENSPFLYVMLNGARRNGGTENLPVFTRWSYYNVLEGSLLCIDDPMFYQYPELLLGWYYGRPERSALTVALQIVKAVADGRKVIFIGSSGGGTAAIYAACQYEGSLSIAINPQTYIGRFPLAADFTRMTGIDLGKYDNLRRNDLVKLLVERKGRHLILVNVLDKSCWTEHIEPLCDALHIRSTWGGKCPIICYCGHMNVPACPRHITAWIPEMFFLSLNI